MRVRFSVSACANYLTIETSLGRVANRSARHRCFVQVPLKLAGVPNPSRFEGCGFRSNTYKNFLSLAPLKLRHDLSGAFPKRNCHAKIIHGRVANHSARHRCSVHPPLKLAGVPNPSRLEGFGFRLNTCRIPAAIPLISQKENRPTKIIHAHRRVANPSARRQVFRFSD